MVSAADLARFKDGKRVSMAGIVLVRQRPGSASGVTFITVEDETGHANLVVWKTLFEQQRRLILTAGMMGVRGKLQREGEVMHIIAYELIDLTDLLRSVGDREDFVLPHGRGDEAKHGGGPDSRERVPKVRDIFIPDRNTIKVPTRDFR
jgi:error-prone DNA polymerase